MTPPDWLDAGLLAAGSAGSAALAVAFVAINLGLRLLPGGRAFLAAARTRGRLFATPSRGSAPSVLAVFAAAAALAVLAGWLAWHAALERLAPAIWPRGTRVAEVAP